MKKVLILMAERTGTGHKSAANAIEKKLRKKGFDVKQLDGFRTAGPLGLLVENSYTKITTTTPLLFYIPYLISQRFPNFIHFLMYQTSKIKLKKEILNYNPDIILSVHSLYNNCVTKLLKKNHLNIPFYVNVIDLIDPPKLWINKDAKVLFVPTLDIKRSYIKKGIPKQKIIISGFPIRDNIKRRKKVKVIKKKVNILIVNPSINVFKTVKFVKEVSRLDNVSINVICGRDKRMYRMLQAEKKLKRINNNVNIHSFITNMNYYLNKSHIILAKAGPNMILEAAKSGTAIVITGHIKGQENRNYEYVEKNGFGFKCENPDKIYERLKDFIESNELKECLVNTLSAHDDNGSNIISEYFKENG